MPGRHPQSGFSMFMALIALVVMALAGVALVRSVDTSSLIAGNLAFHEAALSAADVGVENAFTALSTITTTSVEQNIPNQYFATQQPVDSAGVPTTINWTTVPATSINGNSVQYVIDRLCQGPLPVTDLQTNCVSDPSDMTGSKKAGAAVFTHAYAVYYRVTVRVTGPRGTVSMVQSIISM